MLLINQWSDAIKIFDFHFLSFSVEYALQVSCYHAETDSSETREVFFHVRVVPGGAASEEWQHCAKCLDFVPRVIFVQENTATLVAAQFVAIPEIEDCNPRYDRARAVGRWNPSNMYTYVTVSFPMIYSGLILGLRPANERRRCKVSPSLIGWAQSWNQPRYCFYM